jgi:hypothetical protein
LTAPGVLREKERVRERGTEGREGDRKGGKEGEKK